MIKKRLLLFGCLLVSTIICPKLQATRITQNMSTYKAVCKQSSFSACVLNTLKRHKIITAIASCATIFGIALIASPKLRTATKSALSGIYSTVSGKIKAWFKPSTEQPQPKPIPLPTFSFPRIKTCNVF